MNNIQQLIESSKLIDYKPVYEFHEAKKGTGGRLRQTSVKKQFKAEQLNVRSRPGAAIQNKGIFVNKGGQDEKAFDYNIEPVYSPSISSSQKADIFTRVRVLKRLRQLPPNVIITDFDQTITDVKSGRDYFEEFKAVRSKKNRILLWKDILGLILLRVWSKKFPSQRNKRAFYKFLLPGLSVYRIAHRHEINPNFLKAARTIQHIKSDAIFGVCSVGIGQIVEKTIAKIGLNGYGLMLNIYEEEKGILTGNLMNDYLFTESDKQDFPNDRIILGDDSDQKWLNSWPFFININTQGFEKKIRKVLTRTKSRQQTPIRIDFTPRDLEIIAAT